MREPTWWEKLQCRLFGHVDVETWEGVLGRDRYPTKYCQRCGARIVHYLGRVELAILTQLLHRDIVGRQLRLEINNRGVKVGRVLFYVKLAKLQELGIIDYVPGQYELEGQLIKFRTYSITEEGREQLALQRP